MILGANKEDLAMSKPNSTLPLCLQGNSHVLSPQEALAYRQLKEVCEDNSLGEPDPTQWYLCIANPSDYKHWTEKPASEFVMVGYAKSGPAFRFLAFKIGVCAECVNTIDSITLN